MSTLGAGTGKERSAAINFWILLLVVALIALIVNAYLSTRYASQESTARELVADIMVLSQQNAKFAADAANGGLEAFDELESTRRDIQSNITKLRDGDAASGLPGYIANPEVKIPLQELTDTWTPINEASSRILASKEMVLGLTDTAGAFSASVPQLQAYMDEVVRAMGESGAASSQIYTAVRQIVLADRMLRRVTQILQGGAGAMSAAGSFSRDATMFGQVLGGLQNGLPEQNIRRIDSPAARDPLAKVAELYASVQADVETILNASTELFEVKEAADTIFTSSNDLLQDARTLNQALINLPSSRPFPNTYIGYGAGALAIVGILGLLFTLYRDQVKRFRVTQELNQRNQEAILRLLDEMGSLAEGDLTVRATVTEDITGAIADSINFAVEALRSLVTTINETAVQVAAAAQETQATAMHLAEAAEHQAQQITSASAAINEIAVSIDEVSKNSAESADVAQRSVQIAAKGAEVVRQTIQGMDSIRDQIQETSKRIKRLGESSQEIGSIVELINDISEQTNILALNAAIQAASAGEAGRGFAVVADEVQRLAERASNATKRIETLVQTIQADTNEAVSSMEQTTAEVVAGARLAEDAGLALGEIETVSNDLADLIQNISEAARQQSAAATNISATMNVIQEITTQTSVGASQTAESIGNLAQLAADLRRSVADFKLPG
ncbi:methyl-accepting chemotaxis protein [Chiayiivirga flava]|uniref:Twitching motility protein PilJ n=1 Tax=Chiayiivirga flava TaxID=659595 RepID=A0A7W8G018_9GAMM|nr:methyl-accepting chemotaxis protein [Chiayiivirga flava]MBB5207248.1 twitching motility protein PilJ [Chiayiivirga flava]